MTTLKASKREKIEQIKHECNHAKSELIRYLRELEEVSPRQAKKLDKIIARLETWQNTK